MDADVMLVTFSLTAAESVAGHCPLSTPASIGLSKALGPFTVFSFHLSLDNSLCILNKDFILPTRRKLLTRCS